MDMILVLIIGIGVAFNAGLWIGGYIVSNAQKPLINDYKHYEKYWFDEYIKMLGYYNEMTSMWMKEVVKNKLNEFK